MKGVHASFSVRKVSENRIHTTMEVLRKLVHACFSMRRDLDSSVSHCGGGVNLG